MSERRREVLRFIDSFTSLYRRSPTMREIGAAHGFGVSRAHAVITALEKAGALVRWKGHRRGIVMIVRPLPEQVRP